MNKILIIILVLIAIVAMYLVYKKMTPISVTVNTPASGSGTTLVDMSAASPIPVNNSISNPPAPAVSVPAASSYVGFMGQRAGFSGNGKPSKKVGHVKVYQS